jgi:hypothetical protein
VTNPSLDDVKSEVQTQVSDAKERASTAVHDTTTFIGALRDAAMISPPNTGLSFNGGWSMNIPGISAVAPGRPTASLEAIKSRIGILPPADFSTVPIATEFPTITLKNIPSPTISLPDAPIFTTELSAEKPTIADVINAVPPLESVPDKLTSIGGYAVPSAPGLNIPDFGLEPLPAYNISLPDISFSYVEPEYTSALKDALTAKLLSDVENGGTGLSEEVENAIWERTRERDNKDYEEASTKVDSKWSGRGFSLPDGVLVEAQRDLIVDDRNQRIERSRDILIKQADLAQVNTHFALTSSMNLEQLELNHANEVNNRALEAAKSVMEFGIAFHNLKITDYNIQLERYKAQIVEQNGRLAAEKLRLEAYRMQLLEVEAKSSLDKDLLSEYNLDLERYDKQLKLFTAEQSAVTIALGIEELKIDLYKAHIDDHRARISAQDNEAKLYLAQVQGELGKVQVYTAELEAEKTRVAVLKIQVDVEIAKIKQNLELQNLSLREFLGNVDKYKAEVSIASTEMGMEAVMYGHDIDLFRAEVAKDATQLELGVESLIKSRALDIQDTNVRLENAKANLQSVISTAAIRVEAAKGIGSVYASVASAVASGFNAIASIESGGLSSENEEL